jgi:hypothetical protein
MSLPLIPDEFPFFCKFSETKGTREGISVAFYILQKLSQIVNFTHLLTLTLTPDYLHHVEQRIIKAESSKSCLGLVPPPSL